MARRVLSASAEGHAEDPHPEETMDGHRIMNRGISALLVAALATSLLAPAAEAGRRRPHRHGPVIIERHSDAGALFGFLGGLVLGAVIADARTAPPPACARTYAGGYDYHDPYCRLTFTSLERYEDHLARHRHPRTAEVVDVRSGRCVDVVRWHDGGWVADGEGTVVEDGRSRADAPAYEEWDD